MIALLMMALTIGGLSSIFLTCNHTSRFQNQNPKHFSDMKFKSTSMKIKVLGALMEIEENWESWEEEEI